MLEHNRMIICVISRDEAMPSRVNRAPSGFMGITGYVNLPPTVHFAHPTRKNTQSCFSLVGYARVCSTMLECFVQHYLKSCWESRQLLLVGRGYLW